MNVVEANALNVTQPAGNANNRSSLEEKVDRIVNEGQLLSDVASKHSTLWNCVGRKGEEKDGYLYLFKLRAEFRDPVGRIREDAVAAASSKIFPAVESTPTEMTLTIICDSTLTYLGYNEKKASIFSFPDKKYLENRWKELREYWVNLPELRIASSDGVETDENFIQQYLDFDATLSTGKEFLHDHQAHLMPTLKAMIGDYLSVNLKSLLSKKQLKRECPYPERKAIVAEKIREGRKVIEDSGSSLKAELFTCLSMSVDLVSNLSNSYLDQLGYLNRWTFLVESEKFREYFCHREDHRDKYLVDGEINSEAFDQVAKAWKSLFPPKEEPKSLSPGSDT